MPVNSVQSGGGLASVFQAVRSQGQQIAQASHISPRERSLRLENSRLSSENLQLEQRNRDLRSRNDRLEDENRDLESEVQSMEQSAAQRERQAAGARNDDYSGYPKAAAYRITQQSENSGAGRMFSAFA
jgi:predicted RNase H-like nuclease (RuvC/YqgF family)